MVIDTSFDFRSDAGGGDPDSTSATLKRYHQLLWSKPLPIGPAFTLDAHTPYAYLHHSSEIGEFWLGSDAVMATYHNWVSAQHLIQQFPSEEIEYFETIGYTIGGMIIFPNNMIDRLHTLNQARGVTRAIADRLDLTLECIRRYYQGVEDTPLGPVIARYSDFFSLFRDFDGYVDFFLLQDLVDASGRVRFFTEFDTFSGSGLPRTVGEYARFRDSSIAFIKARNARIANWSSAHLNGDLGITEGVTEAPVVVQLVEQTVHAQAKASVLPTASLTPMLSMRGTSESRFEELRHEWFGASQERDFF